MMLFNDDWPKLAILYDSNATFSPSDNQAIQKFIDQASLQNIYAEVITKSDYHKLGNYDYLFIRETTHPHDHTFKFAEKAEKLGLKVLDNPDVIIKCCNKKWQTFLFRLNCIPHPTTWILTKENHMRCGEHLGYPFIIKQIDSSFSQHVYKLESYKDYQKLPTDFFAKPEQYIAQEFIATDFDWRITLLDGELLFCCKYYMPPGDFRVAKYDTNGDFIEGAHDPISVSEIPVRALQLAKEVCSYFGRGLFGVDIKQTTSGEFYVMEVNDNPNIDHGIEDELEGDEIYRKVINWFAA